MQRTTPSPYSYQNRVKDYELGPYALMTKAKEGSLPDGRTRIGKTIRCFLCWLKGSYEAVGQWNDLMEARLAMDVPIVVFYLSCKMLNEETKTILADFKWAHGCLERLIRDISNLAKDKPTKVPDLREYINTKYGDGK